MRQVGDVARIGDTVVQRSLMDQKPRAAIGQHIGDLGLLLAGGEQHRHQPGMRRAQHGQDEFDAVAEQDGDTVAALQAERAKSRRDLRRLPGDVAPRHPAVTADHRLPVRIPCNGFGHHRCDTGGPLTKRRNDAVAEAWLEAHRRNGMLRPVHGSPRQLFFIS